MDRRDIEDWLDLKGPEDRGESNGISLVVMLLILFENRNKKR